MRVRFQGRPPQVRDELVVADTTIHRDVGVGDEFLHLLALEGAPQHLTEVFHRDVTRIVGVEPLECSTEEVAMEFDAAGEHRCKEVGVVDGFVVVGIKRLKDLHAFAICDVELVDHDLLELRQRDRALVVLVHGNEVLPDFGALLVRERPGHHRQCAAPKPGRLPELSEAFHDGHVDLGSRLLVLNPRVLQGLLGRQTLIWIDLQQRLDEFLGVGGD
mmetsp:Transcript_84810/g.236659  ORF Transcript_84810/g.236659 Transcript_84810/m.236659 type:complete len:217 (-) Transcript_84810:928-1578(-)